MAKHATLHFDLHNPRSAERDFKNEEEVIQYLIENADVDELVTSMQSAGWVDFEPLIVERKTGVVLEGNRRLAALRLLTDPAARGKHNYRLPNEGKAPALPAEVRVRWVENRAEARSFIAFKHINGPFKWDALAKAKYAAQWLDDGADADDVARQIGDNHNTVLRLVNGWRVLNQATREGFDVADITARRFNFSHLYTALARPNARAFLGLSDDPSEQLPKNPIKKDNTKQLEELMGWLYGQAKQGRQHVIKSQNPDLNRLIKILGEKRARATLASTKDFARAFEIVEPASNRFEEALAGAANMSEKALGLVSHYDAASQPTLFDTVKGLASTVRALRDQMKSKSEGTDDL